MDSQQVAAELRHQINRGIVLLVKYPRRMDQESLRLSIEQRFDEFILIPDNDADSVRYEIFSKGTVTPITLGIESAHPVPPRDRRPLLLAILSVILSMLALLVWLGVV